MENKKTAVFGIYSSMASADTATDELVRAGFASSIFQRCFLRT
jgi:hypothetical protein